MEKENLIKLTNNLYRLTLLFPKKEPLRYKIRELVDDILANFIRLTQNNPGNYSREIERELEILDSYFEVAKSQNWVNPSEILEIQREYSKIREGLNKAEKADRASPLIKVSSINERQEKILEVLKEKEKIQVWELKAVFPEISKRTLRRDFEQLLRQGLVERIGERNNTFYQLKIEQEIG